MNESLKPINTSIYDFPGQIRGGYVYVDKTARLYELAKPGANSSRGLRIEQKD